MSASGVANRHYSRLGLTPKETEVLLLLCDDLSNKEISRRLCITVTTTKVHTSSIYFKLGVRGRVGAVRWAIREGLVEA